jgi:hypothetical protein
MAVYTICFDRPLEHAKHYTGWSPDHHVVDRLLTHEKGGSGAARIMQVCKERGIGFEVVSIEYGDGATRQRERQLKKQGGASRRCPRCRAAAAAKLAMQPRLPLKRTRSRGAA